MEYDAVLKPYLLRNVHALFLLSILPLFPAMHLVHADGNLEISFCCVR